MRRAERLYLAAPCFKSGKALVLYIESQKFVSYTDFMQKILPGLLVAAGAALAYVWLHLPMLSNFSMQAFAGTLLILIILRKLRREKTWQLLSDQPQVELPLLTFAFLLLIGATGNIESYFYPAIYVYLFIVALAAPAGAAITAAMAAMLFFYALSGRFGPQEAGALITLPVILVFFLFAKRQYENSLATQQNLRQSQSQLEALEGKEQTLTAFLSSFLSPKLAAIRELAGKKDTPLKEIILQLDLLESESKKMAEQHQAQQTEPAASPPPVPPTNPPAYDTPEDRS